MARWSDGLKWLYFGMWSWKNIYLPICPASASTSSLKCFQLSTVFFLRESYKLILIQQRKIVAGPWIMLLSAFPFFLPVLLAWLRQSRLVLTGSAKFAAEWSPWCENISSPDVCEPLNSHSIRIFFYFLEDFIRTKMSNSNTCEALLSF